MASPPTPACPLHSAACVSTTCVCFRPLGPCMGHPLCLEGLPQVPPPCLPLPCGENTLFNSPATHRHGSLSTCTHSVSALGPLPLTCHELRIVCHSVSLSHVECGGRCPCPCVLRAQHRACCSPGACGVPPGGLSGKSRAEKACGCGQMVAEACAGALGSSAVSPPPPPVSIPAHTSPSAPSQSPGRRPGAFSKPPPARAVVIVPPTMSVLNKQMFIVNP